MAFTTIIAGPPNSALLDGPEWEPVRGARSARTTSASATPTARADLASAAVCRPSTASYEPNVCYTAGNCTVDSNCGPGGWCSPSLIGMGACSCDSFALCPDAGSDGSTLLDSVLPASVRERMIGNR